MCTNFISNLDGQWSRKHLGIELAQDLPLEAYPGYLAPLLRLEKHTSGQTSFTLRPARFGLVPHWTQPGEVQRISRYTYNARSESVNTKPSYRMPFRQRQWGVVLLKDFFEPSYESGQAQRMRISLLDDEPFGIACLWDEWTNAADLQECEEVQNPDHSHPADTSSILSFSMLTLNADRHPVMSRMHAPGEEKRTPLVLNADQLKPWLEGGHEDAKHWLSGEQMPALKAQLAPISRVSRKRAPIAVNPNPSNSAEQGQLF